MKKYTLNVTTYSFSELSEEVKQKLYKRWEEKQSNNSFFVEDIANDAIPTLKEFCRIFDIKLKDYYLDTYSYEIYYNTDYPNYDKEDKINPIRLAKYIWNNFARYITQGKFYCKSKYDKNEKWTYIKRHSKIKTLADIDCPLTGMCYDCAILDPIIDCLTYKKFYTSFEDLYDDCFDSFFNTLINEMKYRLSYEYFIEEMKMSGNEEDTEYLEDGTIFEDVGSIIDVAIF